MRHRFHSICPYFAMFPESFVEHWVSRLTAPGDLVADPFSGRGTTAFQSLLLGRAALAGDVNPVAYVLSRAKTNSPTAASVLARLDELETAYTVRSKRRAKADLYDAGPATEFFRLAFAASTLRELRYLRDNLAPFASDTDCMIAALVLGALHGESSSSRYLSNQMPRTISTKPAYSVRYWNTHNLTEPPQRDTFVVLRQAVEFRYATGRPRRKATVHLSDMRELPHLTREAKVKLIVTSPPYLDTTSFEEDQWLRLWFLGGSTQPKRSVVSRDDRLTTRDAYWRLIADLWRTVGYLLEPGGHVVIRIAGRGLSSEELCDGLEGTSSFTGRRARLRTSAVSPIERRQTDAFRPGSTGRRTEVDCHFQVH
jgi:hypothetical protein